MDYVFPKQKVWEMRLNRAAKALNQHGFLAETVPDRAAARQRVLELVGPDETVGVGGSVSIREAGIIEALQARGTMVNHHWLAPFGTAERLALRRKTLTSDWYLASANALSETGEVVNIDGVGDRIAAMIFAVPKVILVVGRNKLAPTLADSQRRAREVAAVINSHRVGMGGTPCIKAGRCLDCNVEERGCRITVLIERAPLDTEFHVLLVNEDLGY
ncbi:MAG TPA: LUD domain-containing protein [Firmicutes bacterium]|jgi:hypothetical protein|nr:LUD domain-containing protein [Bacillota bacterium]